MNNILDYNIQGVDLISSNLSLTLGWCLWDCSDRVAVYVPKLMSEVDMISDDGPRNMRLKPFPLKSNMIKNGNIEIEFPSIINTRNYIMANRLASKGRSFPFLEGDKVTIGILEGDLKKIYILDWQL